MKKQEVIDAIHYLYFKQEEKEIGNLKLESYEEDGDWQIVVSPVDDEDEISFFCYYDSYADEFKVVAPEQVYEWIANDYDWTF